MRRRDFLKYSAGGAAALFVGQTVPSYLQDEAFGQVTPTLTLNFTITDALKNMVTHNDINQAQCYFWIYKDANLPAECPGPHVFVQQGDTVAVSITNALDEPHAFFIPGMIDSGPIAPGATFTGSFVATPSGTHLYFDNLNDPVNRVMGLHGALVVMPRLAPIRAAGNKVTPFDNPSPQVQRLFNDLGVRRWWPGLAWEDRDPATRTRAFRQYIWLVHQASPNLFAEVGSLPAGQIFDAAEFRRAFLRDPFSPTRNNRIPQYFTINGQSGHSERAARMEALRQSAGSGEKAGPGTHGLPQTGMDEEAPTIPTPPKTGIGGRLQSAPPAPRALPEFRNDEAAKGVSLSGHQHGGASRPTVMVPPSLDVQTYGAGAGAGSTVEPGDYEDD